MAEAFDVGEIERTYAFLDECPTEFVQDIVTLPLGTLEERVRGLREWRDALLDGRLPTSGRWPPENVAAPARAAIDSLGILRFCKGQAELVDELLLDVLASFRRASSKLAEDVARRLGELEALERQRAAQSKREKGEKKRTKFATDRLDEETRDRLRRQAERDVANSGGGADAELANGWSERTRAWSEIADVFGDRGIL